MIYLADDEPLAAQKLQLFLQMLGIAAGDLRVFGDGLSLVEALTQDTTLPELLFLDIQMPGLTGIEVLQRLKELPQGENVKVIITSAYDQYAIDGFNFGVTDYLLKPYTLDRLKQALEKARPEAMFNIRCEGRTERVKVSDIVCLEALKDYTQFTLSDGRKLTTLGTLLSFEQQLPESRFARVQRSYIVGLAHVRSYNSQSLILTTGEEVPIGKTYRESLISKI